MALLDRSTHRASCRAPVDDLRPPRSRPMRRSGVRRQRVTGDVSWLVATDGETVQATAPPAIRRTRAADRSAMVGAPRSWTCATVCTAAASARAGRAANCCRRAAPAGVPVMAFAGITLPNDRQRGPPGDGLRAVRGRIRAPVSSSAAGGTCSVRRLQTNILARSPPTRHRPNSCRGRSWPEAADLRHLAYGVVPGLAQPT